MPSGNSITDNGYDRGKYAWQEDGYGGYRLVKKEDFLEVNEEVKQCTCGARSIGYDLHSDWCDAKTHTEG